MSPPPHTHTHRRAHRRTEIIQSIVDESILDRTFTASLLRRRRRRRRGRAVQSHRPGVASHASTHRRADRGRSDSTRCAATRLELDDDRGDPRVVDGTIDGTTSSIVLHCTPYRVSTSTDDDAVFYEIGVDDVIGGRPLVVCTTGKVGVDVVYTT